MPKDYLLSNQETTYLSLEHLGYVYEPKTLEDFVLAVVMLFNIPFTPLGRDSQPLRTNAVRKYMHKISLPQHACTVEISQTRGMLGRKTDPNQSVFIVSQYRDLWQLFRFLARITDDGDIRMPEHLVSQIKKMSSYRPTQERQRYAKHCRAQRLREKAHYSSMAKESLRERRSNLDRLYRRGAISQTEYTSTLERLGNVR